MTRDGVEYLQKLLSGFKINHQNYDVNSLIEASENLDMLIYLYEEENI